MSRQGAKQALLFWDRTPFPELHTFVRAEFWLQLSTF